MSIRELLHPQPYVVALSNCMLALNSEAPAVAQLDACVLAARSLKNAARICGMLASAELVEAVENCLAAARRCERTLGQEEIHLMLRGIDLLERLAETAPAVESIVHTVGLPATASQQGVVQEPHSGNGTENTKVKRVLVVDDSLEVREIERQLLSRRGYEVEIAVDGVDGWNTLQAGNFDLVLTDVDMPLFDGIQLTRRIRKDRRFESLPVLIACDEDSVTDRWRGFDAGADYYVIKGCFQDTLAQAVASLIGPAQS